MGGGKRKPLNKSKPKKSLFIEGGILPGFNSPINPGKNSSGSKKKNSPVNSFRYDYHSQDVLQSESVSEGGSIGIGTRPVVLLDTKDHKIVAFEDVSPLVSMEGCDVSYRYEYSSEFVLGENSCGGLGYVEESDVMTAGVIDEEEEEGLHRGLGFSDKLEGVASGAELSSAVVQEAEAEDLSYDSSSHEIEEDDGEVSMDETPSRGRNSAFVSIGGVRVYTQDISDDESDEEDEEGSSSDTSDSDDSEDTSDFDSDIDEDVMQDYLEGIGGSSKVLESKWLALQNLDGQQLDDDSDDTSDGYGGTLKKLSGVALQETSREYGRQKQSTKKKPSAASRNSKDSVTWDTSLDDLMLAKDPRRASAKKKHVTQFPQSWPSRSQKSKKFVRYPGEKKKHRKEGIAAKRRDSMLNRGVDLTQINSTLKQMVLNVDMLAFQPMHTRDCSQVQRLASIYCLRSACQGSGKKRFVTVSRTQHTRFPSASDEIRLEKFIGACKDDADFSVADTPQRIVNRSAQNKSSQHSANRQGSSGNSDNRRRSSGRKSDVYASQPVAFVSSGVMQSDTLPVNAVESKEISEQENKTVACTSLTVGSFEVHTKGFGSKMMAKMGYVEGEGLGKDGKGMSQPIEVIQRPKSLGLGMKFEENSAEPVTMKIATKPSGGSRGSGSASASASASARKAATPTGRFGAFEKHTKGFGSKMMAKMGFIEGTDLGRDSQGIATPLTAVRRPRARGLGEEAN